MRRTSEYAKFPGHCFVTRSSNTSHGVLDLDHYVDGEGAVMLSGKVVEEAAGLWGYLSPEKALDLIEERDALLRQVDELQLKLEALDGVRKASLRIAESLTSNDAIVTPVHDAILMPMNDAIV